MASQLDTHTFGQRLQLLRREQRLTQMDVSERTALSKSYISFLESGTRHPSREVVLKLAEMICPRQAAIRDELLVLAGFVPQNTAYTSNETPVPQAFGPFLAFVLNLIRQADYERAETEIQAGFSRFKLTAQMQTLLAHLELARQSYEQAILLQKTALEHYHLTPTEESAGLRSVDFILNLGVMYFLWADQAMYAVHEQSSKKAAQSFRDLAAERYRLAQDVYLQALQQEPEHVYVLDELGRVHINLADLTTGQLAREHWQAAIQCLRQVLAHRHKQSLPDSVLQESTAFLALAYAKTADFKTSFLLIDTLGLFRQPHWLIPYIESCCAALAYQEQADELYLDRALFALVQAWKSDPEEVRLQLQHDLKHDLRVLQQYRSQELEDRLK